MSAEYILYETVDETREALKVVMERETWPLGFVVGEVARILPGTSQLHLQAFVSGRKVPDSLHAAIYRFVELYREETAETKTPKRAILENLQVLKRRAKTLTAPQIDALPENELRAFFFALAGELGDHELAVMRDTLKEKAGKSTI